MPPCKRKFTFAEVRRRISGLNHRYSESNRNLHFAHFGFVNRTNVADTSRGVAPSSDVLDPNSDLLLPLLEGLPHLFDFFQFRPQSHFRGLERFRRCDKCQREVEDESANIHVRERRLTPKLSRSARRGG